MFVGFYVSYTQTSNKITYRVMFGVRFPTDQSMANIPICEVSKSKHTLRAVVQFVNLSIVRLANLSNCLAYDWTVKQIIERL